MVFIAYPAVHNALYSFGKQVFFFPLKKEVPHFVIPVFLQGIIDAYFGISIFGEPGAEDICYNQIPEYGKIEVLLKHAFLKCGKIP